MDQNTPLDAQDRTAHRAENAEYGIAARQKFIAHSTELATLLVEDARTAITTQAPAKLQNHAANVETLFRGVRLSDKLVAPPTPEPAPRPARPTSTYQGINTQHPDNTGHLDGLDQPTNSIKSITANTSSNRAIPPTASASSSSAAKTTSAKPRQPVPLQTVPHRGPRPRLPRRLRDLRRPPAPRPQKRPRHPPRRRAE